MKLYHVIQRHNLTNRNTDKGTSPTGSKLLGAIKCEQKLQVNKPEVLS